MATPAAGRNWGIDRKMSMTFHYDPSARERRAIPTPSLLSARSSSPARKSQTGPPFLSWSVLWRGLTHIRTHHEVLRLLLKFPPIAEMVFKTPIFAVRYLAPDFLARGFTVPERAACLLHHYERLHGALPDGLLRQTLQDEITIHEIIRGTDCFALTMGLSRPNVIEGELSLNLRVDGELVFILSFTIVPGWVVKSPASEILLITRLQGVKGCYSKISLATRTLNDVAPAALLLSALQGVASVLGIVELAAVPATRQCSYSEEHAVSFKEAYDDFFVNQGMSKGETGFYYSSSPLQEKPLTSIKQGHKLRTKRRRAFKQQIRDACADFLGKFGPGASPTLSI